MTITGHTRVAGLIGYPARYSLSPVLHAAAYASIEFDATYVVFPVTDDQVGDAVRAVSALDLLGVSVTLPHKEAVIPFLDDLSPQARALNAVNTIVRDGDQLVGHNTDGAGFVASLQRDHDIDVVGLTCAVMGAGGAARAVIAALAEAGAAQIAVVNRSPERAAEAAVLAGAAGRVGTADDIPTVDLVVNATPIGMDTHSGTPIEASLLREGQFVADLIYAPTETVLLKNAAARGCITANGIGMLVHQAAEQVALWTGTRPSTDIMRAALVDH